MLTDQHKFTGHEYDDDTELIYAKARYYDSGVGKGAFDRVDTHWGRLIGSVVLSSIFAAAPVAVVGNDNGRDYQRSVGSETARNVGANVQRAGDQIVSKNLNIQPTITVRPGYAVNIVVHKDLILEPYSENNGGDHFDVSGATNQHGGAR